ncbi:MAG: hypothetical protein ACPGO3_14825 [Magnetospiraceae bacterium]
MSDSRRRFLTTSVAAGAFVTSLKSQSAFAAECTPSAALSGNLSGRHGTCSAFDSQFWINAARTDDTLWPLGVPPETPYSAVFGEPLVAQQTLLARKKDYDVKTARKAPAAVAGERPSYFGDGQDFTLLQVLRNSPEIDVPGTPSDLSRETVVTYLNAAFFSRPDVHYIYNNGLTAEEVRLEVHAQMSQSDQATNRALYRLLQQLNSNPVESANAIV